MKDVRRRAKSWLLLSVLFGLLCGAATAAFAGAQRTGSAFERLADETLAADVIAVMECSDDCAARSARVGLLPSVAEAAPVVTYLAAMTTSAGRPLSVGEDACYTGAGEIDLVLPVDGQFGSTVNRYHLVAGSVPDPASTDQVLIASEIARRFDLGVGDQLTLRGNACEDDSAAQKPRTLRIVGIESSTFEQPPEIGFYVLGVHGTAALFRELVAADVEFTPGVAVRFAPGGSQARFVEEVAEARLDVIPVLPLSEMARGIAKSTRPDAVALTILGGFAVLAALAVVGPALIQQAASIGVELRTLRVLGFTRIDLLGLGVRSGLFVGGIAAAVAGGVAIGLSPFTTVGEARRFDPALGVFAGPHVVVGVLATIAAAIILIAIGTLIGARKDVTAWFRSVSPAAWLVRALNLRPTVATGVRMALETRRNAASVLALAGVLAGTVGLIATLTFSSSLAHFDRSPALVGWNWDRAAFFSEGESEEPLSAQAIAERRATLLAVPGVSRASLVTFFPPQFSLFGDVESYPMAFTGGVDSVAPTVIAGRAPVGSAEVLLNPGLARSLGAKIGDVVELHPADLKNPERASADTREFQVVGTGIVPLGDGRVDLGYALSMEGLMSMVPGTGPQIAVVDLEPGADRANATKALEALPFLHDVFGDVDSASKIVQLDIAQVAGTPRIAGGLFGLTSAAVLAHSVISSGRKRRRELATCRAIGMTARQATSASVWQAMTSALVAIVAAIPLGAAAGTGLWALYASSLGVKVETFTSLRQIAVVVAAGLVGAALVAFGPAWRAARRATAATLRTE